MGVRFQEIINFLVGTQNGLNKCDDDTFSTLCHEPNDETNLRHEFIESILVAPDGTLLVST